MSISDPSRYPYPYLAAARSPLIAIGAARLCLFVVLGEWIRRLGTLEGERPVAFAA